MCSNNFSEKSLPYHATQERFDSSSTTRSGEDLPAPIEPHRGDVRDAVDLIILTVLGTGNRLSALSPRFLRYWAGTQNQHRETNRLTTGCELAHGYGCVPHAPIQRHSASQRRSLVVQGRRRCEVAWKTRPSTSTDDPEPIKVPLSPALHEINGSCAGFLVSTSTFRQLVCMWGSSVTYMNLEAQP